MRRASMGSTVLQDGTGQWEGSTVAGQGSRSLGGI